MRQLVADNDLRLAMFYIRLRNNHIHILCKAMTRQQATMVAINYLVEEFL